MMNSPSDGNNSTLPATNTMIQMKQRLLKFFQNEYVKDLVSVAVPSTLAAVLFPFFGPVVASPAIALVVHNGLKAFGLSLSIDSIEKMLKPLEGKQIDESDVKAVLKELLPKDGKVNSEATQALVAVIPDVKEAALANPKLDPKWLGESLATSLKEQGGTMATFASKINEVIQLDNTQLRVAIKDMLANWSYIKQTIAVSGKGEVSKPLQSVKGRAAGVETSQGIVAADEGKVTDSEQNIDFR